MNFSNSNIATILVILLLSIPVIRIGTKRNIFNRFTFSGLIQVLNKAFVAQLIIGLVVFLLAIVLDKTFYSNGNDNKFCEVIIVTAYTYLVIGGFIYLPALGILNAINLFTKKLNQ